jgi:hypothetical protein
MKYNFPHKINGRTGLISSGLKIDKNIKGSYITAENTSMIYSG